MSLTRIGSIGINTGIAFAGVTTIVTLNTANDALSIGATVNVGSGITLGASGDIFATGVSTVTTLKVGSGVTVSSDGDVFATGVTTSTTFSGAFSGSGANITALNASNISSGTVPTARLGSGTASSSTFLRGDSTFAAVTSTTINSNTNNYLITGTGTANTLQGESGLTYDGDTLTSDAAMRNIQAGANYVLIGSSNAGGVTLGLDGDSNGDGAGTDYAFLEHNTDGDLIICGDNPANASNLIFKTNSSTERLRIDSSGRVVIGHTSNIGIANHNGRFQLHGTDYDTATMSIVHNGTDSFGPFLFFASQRSGSPGGSTVLQNNDAVGTIRFHAGDGTDMASYCAAIQVKIDGTPGSNDVPGRIMFSTTADGAASPTERLRIESDGDFRLSSDNAATNYGFIRGWDSSTGNMIIGADQSTTGTSGSNLIFRTRGGERARILHSGGITFNGDTATANALDDYEEGTWTASLHSGETCTNSQSTYTRIGRLVITNCYITNFSNFDGNGAEFRINGLPFDAHNTQGGSYHGGGSISYATSWNYSYPLLPLVGSNNNYIYFHRQDGTTNSWKYQDFHNTGLSSGGALIVQMIYETDY